MTENNVPATYIVFGAGPAGLMAAYTLAKNGEKTILLEAESQPGGLAKTLQQGSLRYDLGPHNLHSIYPEIVNLIKGLLNGQIEEHKILSKIYFRGRVVPYPLTGIKVFTSIPLYLAVMAGVDFLFTRIKRRLFSHPSDEASFKEWIINRFGKVLYRIYFEPYASKVWKIDPANLSSIVAKKRIPVLSLFGLIKKILFNERRFHPEDFTQIYNFYPKGGVGVLMKVIEEEILKNNGQIVYDAKIEEVRVSDNKITKVSYKDKNGKVFEIENAKIISSIPLNSLIAVLTGISAEIKGESKLLDYCPMRFFYLVVNKKEVLDVPWVYFSDADAIFNRLSDMSRFSKTLVTGGKTILCLEISCRIDDELWKMPDNQIFNKIMPVLERYGLLRREDVADFFSEFVAHSYPLFFKGFEKITEANLGALEKISGLITIGRQGLYTYANIDDVMRMGILAAELMREENIRINYKEVFGEYLFY
jgi:protoporphyrinogen oxidase